MNKNNLTKLKKHRIRQIRLQRIRENRRLSRKDVSYDTVKDVSADIVPSDQIESAPIINKKYNICHPTYYNTIRIDFPESLDLSENIERTVVTLENIKHEILYGKNKKIILEQENIEKISPDAAIILAAEINRCIEYSSSKKKIIGDYPDNPSVAGMLKYMGFYRFLNIPAPNVNLPKDSRIFFNVISGHDSDMRIVDRLVKLFERAVEIPIIPRKRLCAALIECMDNVNNHAYIKNTKDPVFVGQWWMAGFCDPSTGQVTFTFYDQGVGIPTTLKEKLSVKIRGYLSWSESDMLDHAITKGITRHSSNRHGNGLPSLKGFIDELAPGGFLRVLSGKGDFTYCKNNKPIKKDLDVFIDGSLIMWSIQSDKEAVNDDGTIDLSKQPAQLRLAV